MIGDSDVSICHGFKTIRLAASLSCPNSKRTGCAGNSTAAGIQVHPASRKGRRRFLTDTVFGCNRSNIACRYIPKGDAVFPNMDRKVTVGTACHVVRIGTNRISCTACILSRRHRQASCIDVTKIALDKVGSRKRCCAASIGQRAVNEDISISTSDRERAAIFAAAETDADVIIRLERILIYIGFILGRNQFVVEFLRHPERVPETRRLLGKGGLLIRRERLVRHLVRPIGSAAANLIVIRDESPAMQRRRRPLLEICQYAAAINHVLLCRCLVRDAPPIDLGLMNFISGRGTLVRPGLHSIIRTLFRLVLGVMSIRIRGNHRSALRLSFLILLDALLDRPILPGIGGLALDFPACPVKVRNLDLALDARTRRKGTKLDILIRVIFYLDRAIAVERFDAGFRRIIRRIENGTDDGNVPALDFDITDNEAVIVPVIGNVLDFPACLVRHEDFRTRRHFRYIRHLDLRAAVHVKELVILRDSDRMVCHAALDFGIDIYIARADEDIAIGEDARPELVIRIAVRIDIVKISAVIKRIAADTRDAEARIVRLDEISIRRRHVHAARIDRAAVIHIPVGTRDGDRAARIVDIAFELHGRRSVKRRVALIHIRLRAEIILDGNIRPACLVACFRREGDRLRLVCITFANACQDIFGLVAFDFRAVEIDGSALTGTIRSLAANDVNIAGYQIVRRIVRNLHFRIATRTERARAENVVSFEDDIPKLRGDVTHDKIMGHLLVRLAVQEVVVLAVLGNFTLSDFLPISIEELAVLFRALVREECIG